ncbi:MAG: NAD(P)H-hydrate dehydratase [Thermodesulfovibrionales bacterium]|nr:NAD(P)H-hydrate dehydratase [Thermodesulfovibrionales bacterium]
MRLATAHQMREIDRITIQDYGLSGVILMERAGVVVSDRICSVVNKDTKIVVVCGKGNNGGDGLVVSREMTNRGYDTVCYLFARPDELKDDAFYHYKRAKSFGVDIRDGEFFFQDVKDFKGCLIVDAIFGIGLSKDVGGVFKKLIDTINIVDATVCSVDIPSGICSDTGLSLNASVDADFTVTFGIAKVGHFINDGFIKTGRLFVEDIGFPRSVVDSIGIETFLIDNEMIKAILPKRFKISSKKDYGHVLVIAGSKGKSGASIMCSRAALRAGAGLVTLASSISLIDSIQSAVLEEMTLALPEDENGRISKNALDEVLDFIKHKANVIAIGPGLGQSDELVGFIKDLITHSNVPLVIDADGINLLSRCDAVDTLKGAKAPVVITPHEGEMRRLTGFFSQDKISWAKRFSQDSAAIVCLKGAPTVVCTPDALSYINSTGNPGMATGGSGDVLTGLIAGLIAQGVSVLEASLSGVYLHGLAGDMATQRYGEHCLIAGDIINYLPDAFMSLC